MMTTRSPGDVPNPAACVPSLSAIEARLSGGEKAQDILNDVVDYITLGKPCETSDMAQVIACLADHGARVATDEPGCAFDDLVRKPYRTRAGMFMAVFYRLLGRPDELPFHILAKHGQLQMSDEDAANPDMQQGLRARDSRGRTISHWLWNEDSHLIAQAASIRTEQPGGDTDRARGWWLASVRQAWVLQQQLQTLGVGMEIPDHNGITALDLCASRVEDGSALLTEEFALCRLVKVYQASRDMQGKTAQPSGPAPAPSGPRF